jgi:hypothetical protein
MWDLHYVVPFHIMKRINGIAKFECGEKPSLKVFGLC